MDNSANLPDELSQGEQNAQPIDEAAPVQQSAQYSEQNNYPQYQAAPVQYYQQTSKKPGISTGKRVLIALMLVLAFILGGVLTAFVVMPLIEADYSDIFSNWLPQDRAVIEEAAPEDTESEDTSGVAITSDEDEAQPPPQTTSSADIGGEKPNIDQASNPIVQIAEEVGPAVVGVTVSINQANGEQNAVIDSGYGTGFIISENGYIVTNNHVVQDSDSVRVTLVDGTEYEATVVGTDAASDIAVIKIEATGLTVAALGDSDELRVGETVVAIGNPLGTNLAGSVTSGIVSALNRVISTGGYSQKYVQTDAAINPGNSGGPLLNIEGEVIGINTLKTYLAGYDDYGVPIGTEGIGFAIPASTAIPIIEKLMTQGYVERPGIGVSCLIDVTNAYNVEGAPDGVTVVEVVKGGPADDANLMVNDIIIAVGGVTINTVEELVEQIRTHAIGELVEFTIWRDGEELTLTTVIGDLNKMN
ncbi:MAG: PDZ domain-containing protein [Clostridia bacterium]|nr:PDZ domain-containing protein [Clostridia bacterium]